MSKRPANDAQDGQPSKIASGASKRDNVVMEEMGEFEDAWEDEIESEEENAENEEGADGSIPHSFFGAIH